MVILGKGGARQEGRCGEMREGCGKEEGGDMVRKGVWREGRGDENGFVLHLCSCCPPTITKELAAIWATSLESEILLTLASVSRRPCSW